MGIRAAATMALVSLVALTACGQEDNLIVGDAAVDAGLSTEAHLDNLIGSVWLVHDVSNGTTVNSETGRSLTFTGSVDYPAVVVGAPCGAGWSEVEQTEAGVHIVDSDWDAGCVETDLYELFAQDSTLELSIDRGILTIVGNGLELTASHVQSTSIQTDDPEDDWPTTTIPWEMTLETYPLLGLLDETDANAQIGSMRFILVDADGSPRPSGSDEFPIFMVTIDAWYGVNEYVEFTLSYMNVSLADGQPDRQQCGDTWAALRRVGAATFQHTPNALPEVRGTMLTWGSAECVEYLPVEFASLFKSEVEIEVIADGFLLRNPDALAEPMMFSKLDEPRVDTSTTPPPATTVVAPTTTASGTSSD